MQEQNRSDPVPLNRTPIATYRVQFNRDFTFAQAREILDYLRGLGVSDLYSSPLFLAGAQSTHGYDICRFEEINPALGGRSELDRLAAELTRRNMGLLLDMVPNHMGSDRSNCWWTDVLKHGPDSKFARYFDINWTPDNPNLRNKVLLPVLGDRYGTVLERGELRLECEEDQVYIAYFDHRFPLSTMSEKRLKNEHSSPEKMLAAYSGAPGNWASWNNLHALISEQHYRLAYWRVAAHEINYRRFFDVTELVSVRVEDVDVYQATHQLLFQLLSSGAVTGIRVDHPDGLRDPKTYFDRLQESYRRSTGKDQALYVLAEKILSDDEELPEDWHVQGTTGYDFLNVLNGIFIQTGNEAVFDAIYREFTGCPSDYKTIAAESETLVLERLFVSEVNALTSHLKRLAGQIRSGIDFTEAEIRSAIVQLNAVFPVYRTYVTLGSGPLRPVESDYVQRALAEAKMRVSKLEPAVLEFVAQFLSLEFPQDLPLELKNEATEFAVRFQQLSGPATAKGLEDTAFYRYSRFVSLNEVGGNPGRFGVSLDEFHRFNTRKSQNWPHAMLTTATHDTKRGEDVRARLNVLSEIPEEWSAAVSEWRRLNQPFNPGDSPSANREYFLYQTLVGTWTNNSETDPDQYQERVLNYLLKAVREAKTNTSWIDPNDKYESAVATFIQKTLNSPAFLENFKAFHTKIAYFGVFNSLAQVLLKICSPGVPDFYQGTELWDFSMVDPDNRRPVNFRLRQQLLATLFKRSRNDLPEYLAELLSDLHRGEIKMFLTHALLSFRKDHPRLFESGNYTALKSTGPKAKHICAFSRTFGRHTVIAAAPRLPCTLLEGKLIAPLGAHVWDETRIQNSFSGPFRNVLTGEVLSNLDAAEVFRSFPVALIEFHK